MDEGKRALGDGRAHSDEENVGEQWPRKVRQHFGSILLINLKYFCLRRSKPQAYKPLFIFSFSKVKIV